MRRKYHCRWRCWLVIHPEVQWPKPQIAPSWKKWDRWKHGSTGTRSQQWEVQKLLDICTPDQRRVRISDRTCLLGVWLPFSVNVLFLFEWQWHHHTGSTTYCLIALGFRYSQRLLSSLQLSPLTPLAKAIVERFRQSVVKLSLKMHGCRVIQKAKLNHAVSDK